MPRRTFCAQETQLFIRLNTLSNHANVKAVRHRDDRPHHRRRVGICSCLLHEALVDLQPVHLILQQVREAAEAGAEVIDRDPCAQLADLLQFVEVRRRS